MPMSPLLRQTVEIAKRRVSIIALDASRYHVGVPKQANIAGVK